MSATTILDGIEIVVYILLIPLIIFVAIRHGSTQYLGYVYLTSFSVLRIVADVMGIVNRNSTDPNTITTTSAIHSAGLSPLPLVLAGFAHEAHHYCIKATSSPDEAQSQLTRLRSLQGGFHILSAGGMGLIVYAATKSEKTTDQDKLKTWQDVRKAGAVIMLLGSIAEAIYAVYVYLSVRRAKRSIGYKHLTSLALCTSIGGIFVVGRAAYSVLYTLDSNPDFNPVTGKFGLKLIFIDAVPFCAAAWMIAGAWMTRNIRSEAEYVAVGTGDGKLRGYGEGDEAAMPMAPTQWHGQRYGQ